MVDGAKGKGPRGPEGPSGAGSPNRARRTRMSPAIQKRATRALRTQRGLQARRAVWARKDPPILCGFLAPSDSFVGYAPRKFFAMVGLNIREKPLGTYGKSRDTWWGARPRGPKRVGSGGAPPRRRRGRSGPGTSGRFREPWGGALGVVCTVNLNLICRPKIIGLITYTHTYMQRQASQEEVGGPRY